ncbi:MAG: 3-dehydroquinate synthase [Gammaproteobacteria bacterium]|nr:3-dehydroquinate synthase [Gammaproteobacteria bacterium]MBQ0838412.1 3-dehydroquinate synthase [Gammaproteobacteria bacterium]
MNLLNVELGERSYPIMIGCGLNASVLAPYISGDQVLIVTNETIAPLYLDKLQASLDTRVLDSIVLPDGEQYKTLDTLNTIFDALLGNRHDRSTTLIALGGGVVGDMTGFAAACYQRGVNFIQIPTTLLAQVDSSVGGKTAVNHALGKNMIGAFHQPQCVLIDIETLQSLPEREYCAGLAEVIKYGLITDLDFFIWLEEHMPRLLARENDAVLYAIEHSCRLKARVVSEDEREGGLRAILNLGHTFGHAIETHQGYGQWLHGEAVAAGMYMAADLSMRLGWISNAELSRVASLLAQAGLPIAPPKITAEQFLALMSVDKKALGGQIRLVLLQHLGKAVITADYGSGLLMETLSGS